MKVQNWLQNLWLLALSLVTLDLAFLLLSGLLGDPISFYFFHVISLFVPNLPGFNPSFFGGGLPSNRWLTPVVGLGAIALAQLVGSRISGRPVVRILYNFFILFVVTLITDLLLWHEWRTWKNLF